MDAAKCDASRPLMHTGQEKYAAARAAGLNIGKAAEECRVHRSTASRWEKDSNVRLRIAHLLAQNRHDQREANKSKIQEITFNRNDVIMKLWEIAQKGRSERAQVTALLGLADIFLLRPRNIEDLRRGIGWTEDELDYFDKTGLVPDRIKSLTGATTGEDLIAPPSFATGKAKSARK